MASIMSALMLTAGLLKNTLSKLTFCFSQYSIISAYGMLPRARQLDTVERFLPKTVPSSVSVNFMPSMSAILASMSSKSIFIIIGVAI